MTGPGIEQVFDKFYRGQGVEGGSRHGLGIGLTVARGLTEAMGASDHRRARASSAAWP